MTVPSRCAATTSKSPLPDHDSMNPRTISARFQAISAALGVCTDGEIHRCIMTGDDSRVYRMSTHVCRMTPHPSLMRRVTNSWDRRYLQDYENYVSVNGRHYAETRYLQFRNLMWLLRECRILLPFIFPLKYSARYVSSSNWVIGKSGERILN